MRDLLRVWAKVETFSVLAAIAETWEQLLGDDLHLLKPYLKPEQRFATSYPCPDPVHDSCPRRVICHGPDDIIAVCGNSSPWCESLELHRRDLVVCSLRSREWTTAVVEWLRQINGLEALNVDTPDDVVPLGVLARRGRRAAIMWARRKHDDVETLARGIRSTLGMDLVIVLPPGSRTSADRVLAGAATVLLAPPSGNPCDLQLWRALDLLDPRYRDRRIADPAAIFDEVELEFATTPEHHRVLLNGRELGGFQRSDLKFLRLLLLAAARAADPDVDGGGWLDKRHLYGDDKDHDLEAVRGELRRYDHPALTKQERGALVKSSPTRDRLIRLAVPPAHIRFDESLARLQLVGEQQTGKKGKVQETPGASQRGKNLAQGQKVARRLLAEARAVGVPGPTRGMGEKRPRG